MRRGPFGARYSLQALALLASEIVCACRSPGAQEPRASPLSSVGETWCPEGFEPGPSDTCFSIPDGPTKDTPVLVYLHGMYQGRGDPAEWSAVRVAVDRGFSVVIPRGKRGMCSFRAELEDHFCWPHDPEDTVTIAELVAEWDRVLWQVDALLEGGAHERYVLGSSDGGSFAQHLAMRGTFPARAFAIVNGGSLASPPPRAAAPSPPLLLISATDDVDEATKMNELHEGLSKAGWAHGWCPRAGGRALTNDDVHAAVRFFERAAEGSLKRHGNMYPCEATTAAPQSNGKK